MEEEDMFDLPQKFTGIVGVSGNEEEIRKL